MSRTAQVRISEDMDADAEVIRAFISGHGMGSTLADVIRLSLRQFRLRIDAGLALVDPATSGPAADLATDRAQPAKKPWTPAEEKRLGKASDRDVAAELGRDPDAVALHRRRIGIAKYEHPPPKTAKSRKK